MYTTNDLILDLEGLFQNFPEKLKSAYRERFSNYSEKNLRKIVDCIMDNQEFNKTAPMPATIYKYMKESGISPKKASDVFWSHCITCDTSFPVKTALCPSCSYLGRINESITVVKKGKFYPEDMKWINKNCVKCKKFIGQDPIPFGAKCDSWGSFDSSVKTGKPCLTCECHSCCNELARDKENQSYKNLISEEQDHNWLKYYEGIGMEKGKIFKCSGKRYINLTGEYLGYSPWNIKNEEHFKVYREGDK